MRKVGLDNASGLDKHYRYASIILWSNATNAGGGRKSGLLPDVTADVVYAPRIMAAILPTDQLHWGHYFGGMKHHVHFHHEYPGDCFFAIADYHSLMRGISPERIAKGTLELATVYLAFGLDPNKACLYRQSDVPEITELFWLISCTTSLEALDSDAQTRPKMRAMFTYPILMAADILGLRANIVPVGHNQEADLMRVRDMAVSFNKAIGHDIFPIPEMIQLNADDIPGYRRPENVGRSQQSAASFRPAGR